MGSNFFNPFAMAKSTNYGLDPMGGVIASLPQGAQNFIGKESHFDPLINSKFGADVTPENYALAQKYQAGRQYPTVTAPTDPAASMTGAQGYYGGTANPAATVQPGGGGIAPPAAIAAAPRQTVDPTTARLVWGNQGGGTQQQSAW